MATAIAPMGRGLVPDVTAPATLAYTGGTFRTSRLIPARLRYRSGNVQTAKDSTLTEDAQVPSLDRLKRNDRLADEFGVDVRFQLLWQRTMEAIEDSFRAVNARVDEVAILARLAAVEAQADAANDNAAAAQQAAQQVSQAAQETFRDIDPTFGDIYIDKIDLF